MAITKNHPINTTLKKAVDYICNPAKTDGTLLVYSYGCAPETADIEFEWTREKAREPGPHLARHLIQAFKPGETTPEQAHEIGKQLAEEILGGKYEYVLTTHKDRGHIHNHIIFNDVSFVDFKHSHVNRKWKNRVRRISDRLCGEHGLSVIPPNENKGKSYIEHAAAQQGTSWKAQIKADIDKAVSRSTDFEDFLLRMEIAGYEIKQGKYISFRYKGYPTKSDDFVGKGGARERAEFLSADGNEAECTLRRRGKERFTRGKTLGPRYTEEAIKGRIAQRTKSPKPERHINLLIDIQNNIKAQESKGYEHWAKLYNLKQASKTLNFLTEHNISTYEELERAAEKIHASFDGVSEQIKGTEKSINDTALLIKHAETHSACKPVYEQYKRTKYKTAFENKYRREIILFEASAKYLEGKDAPPIDALNRAAGELAQQKKELYDKYKKLKQQAAEIDVIKSNVDALLGNTQEKEKEPEHHL